MYQLLSNKVVDILEKNKELSFIVYAIVGVDF